MGAGQTVGARAAAAATATAGAKDGPTTHMPRRSSITSAPTPEGSSRLGKYTPEGTYQRTSLILPLPSGGLPTFPGTVTTTKDHRAVLPPDSAGASTIPGSSTNS